MVEDAKQGPKTGCGQHHHQGHRCCGGDGKAADHRHHGGGCCGQHREGCGHGHGEGEHTGCDTRQPAGDPAAGK